MNQELWRELYVRLFRGVSDDGDVVLKEAWGIQKRLVDARALVAERKQ